MVCFLGDASHVFLFIENMHAMGGDVDLHARRPSKYLDHICLSCWLCIASQMIFLGLLALLMEYTQPW